MTIADATWIATAMLHRENVSRPDFSVQEIVEKARLEKLVEGSRSGLKTHVSQHCVANKPPNSADHRILFKTARGRRRLFQAQIDGCHPDRQGGKLRPEKADIPEPYQDLIDWYDTFYAATSYGAAPSHSGHRIHQKSAQARIGPSVSALLQLFSKPLFANSSGDLVIPGSLIIELGVQAGTPLSIRREKDRLVLQPITEDFIGSLVGSCKGETDLLEAREREHRLER
jgi:hypothetical protein